MDAIQEFSGAHHQLLRRLRQNLRRESSTRLRGRGRTRFTEALTSSFAIARSTPRTISKTPRTRSLHSSATSLAAPSAARSYVTIHSSLGTSKPYGSRRGLPTERRPLCECARRESRTGTVSVDPSAASYLTFWHLPDPTSRSLANGDLGLYTFAGQQVVNENFLTARIDHRFSEKDSLFGTYMFDRTPYSSPDGLNNVEFDTSDREAVCLHRRDPLIQPTVCQLRFVLAETMKPSTTTRA